MRLGVAVGDALGSGEGVGVLATARGEGVSSATKAGAQAIK